MDFLSKPYSAKELKRDLTPALEEYSKDAPKLAAINPDFTPREDYLETAKVVVQNIGVLENGLNIIRVYPSTNSIEMGVAVNHWVNQIGGNSILFLFPMDEALEAILTDATKEKIEVFAKNYLAAIQQASHWTITYGAKGYSLSENAKKNYPIYNQILSPQASKLLNRKIEDGSLMSWNMIYAPQPYSANKIGMVFSEYESKILEAMRVKTDEILRKETQEALATYAFQKSETQLVGKDGIFELEIGDTKFEFQVAGRQIFRDVGRVGTDTYLKNGMPDIITNNPCGEFFVAPIESSVNGQLGTNVPSELPAGVLTRTYFKFEDGIAVSIDTSNNELFEKTFDEKSTRVIAEIGRGGQNEKLSFLQEIGKPTGDTLIDEKVFPLHVAIGENTHMGGQNEAKIHHDFSISEINSSGEIVPLRIRKIA